MIKINRGKFSWPNFPHKGWECLNVEREEDQQICDACEVQPINYVHLIRHPNWPEMLEVGCVCAEALCEGYDGRKAENKLRARQERERRQARQEFQARWSLGSDGRFRQEGYTIFWRRGLGWRVRQPDGVFKPLTFVSAEDAKVAVCYEVVG